MSRAVLCGWLLWIVEFAAVALLVHSEFASIWEIQWGGLWLLPALLLVSGGVAVLGQVVWTLLAGTGRPWRLSGTGIGVLLAAAAAISVSGGRHFDPLWRRSGFVGVTVVAVAALAWWLGPRLRTLRDMHPARLSLLAGVSIAALELTNRWLLVRLYPGFHLSLALLTTLVAPLCWPLSARAPESGQGRASKAPFGVALGVIAASVLLLPAARRLAHFDNFRWVVAENAPLNVHALEVASQLVPPPALESGPEDTLARAPGEAADLTGSSVLLITIDALRADHVGAYGYPRPTTPHLDRLAAESVRFESAYCPTPHTSYSITSLMTGKYIRPLLLQQVGQDSETWADHLRRYGYRTAAFYPPAVFFIDKKRFASFEERNLGFEYQKKEFLEGAPRLAQVRDYLDSIQDGTGEAQGTGPAPVFVWVHLFGPHEPYTLHPEHDFGMHDIDRYDSEIAASDATVGQLVSLFRERRPKAVVIVASDHGEEFGDHGGRYHGSSLYEEQVRVPLLISAPGRLTPKVIQGPVQTIDLLPTLLTTLSIPLRPRIRGRDLSVALQSGQLPDEGFAFAETSDHTLLAQGQFRLLCARRVGACQLFNLATDPREQRDQSRNESERFKKLRSRMRHLNASHGRYERSGLRAEGRGWPPAILRGLAGDGDAAEDLAELLNDADVSVRRKSAQLLFELHRETAIPALRLALQRDEDVDVRRWCALALTRLGEGAPLTLELMDDPELRWRRLAALALAEQGDRRARHQLIEWWMSDDPRTHETSLAILKGLSRVKAKEAVYALLRSLDDVRLRPAIATALAEIGEEGARGTLAKALGQEPYHSTREVLALALEKLGAETELVLPLRHWLGVPDPIRAGLGIGTRAGILEQLGGPSKKALLRLRKNAAMGEMVTITVPRGDEEDPPLRLLVQASNHWNEPSRVLVGKPYQVFSYDSEGKLQAPKKVPEIHPTQRVELSFEPGADSELQWIPVPESLGLAAGQARHVVVFTERGIELESLAILPLRRELAPASTEGDIRAAATRAPAQPARGEKAPNSASNPGQQ